MSLCLFMSVSKVGIVARYTVIDWSKFCVPREILLCIQFCHKAPLLNTLPVGNSSLQITTCIHSRDHT